MAAGQEGDYETHSAEKTSDMLHCALYIACLNVSCFHGHFQIYFTLQKHLAYCSASVLHNRISAASSPPCNCDNQYVCICI